MNLVIVVGEGARLGLASKPIPTESIRNLEPFLGTFVCPHQRRDLMFDIVIGVEIYTCPSAFGQDLQ